MKYVTDVSKIILFLMFAVMSSVIMSGSSEAQESVCKLESLPQLPDVTITSVTEESEYAPHCKVAGVIGPEIHFELLLPKKWNGKFVMGGGGGFVGLVVNSALSYGALQNG